MATTAEAAVPYAVQHLTLQDGRSLAYALLGAPLAGAAAVLIHHHGVPASLVEAEPLAAAAALLGVAVVAFDRSGMGESSPNRHMSVQSVVSWLLGAASEPNQTAAVGRDTVCKSRLLPPFALACRLQVDDTRQLMDHLGISEAVQVRWLAKRIVRPPVC